METKFYTTKLTVEFEISTQFGPNDAIIMLQILSRNIPAIKSAKVSDLESDYVPQSEQDANCQAFSKSPKILKS